MYIDTPRLGKLIFKIARISLRNIVDDLDGKGMDSNEKKQ